MPGMGVEYEIDYWNFEEIFKVWGIGKRGWCASRICDQLFQTRIVLENNLQNRTLTQWELKPGPTQTKKRLFQKMEITGSLTKDQRC
jgi:hypothetical protein